ncbi:MAG: hypothetical protein GX947_10455 [Tissierellia bacterium]|nr:hypothetical protein [Tissierellia bacterium]
MLLNMYESTKDTLGYKMKTLSEEYGIEYYDLLSICLIFCKNINQLKEEYSKCKSRYAVIKINDKKWTIIDSKTVSVVNYFDDELMAYRAARSYTILKDKNKINTFSEKL